MEWDSRARRVLAIGDLAATIPKPNTGENPPVLAPFLDKITRPRARPAENARVRVFLKITGEQPISPAIPKPGDWCNYE